MRKDFYVFRHGETELNLQKRIQGSGMNVDINPTGQDQALLLANKFNNISLQAIFSSPLIRAVHTAEVVAKAKNVPIIIKNDLRECFYGEAEGQKVADVKTNFPQVIDNWTNPLIWNIAYPNAESKKQALERVWAQIEKLVDEPYNIMGIAIHAGTMGSLLNFLHYDFEAIPNCAMFHLIYENENWRIEGNLF